MGEWANGRMGEWANGRMGEWANGRMGVAGNEIAVATPSPDYEREDEDKGLLLRCLIRRFASISRRPSGYWRSFDSTLPAELPRRFAQDDPRGEGQFHIQRVRALQLSKSGADGAPNQIERCFLFLPSSTLGRSRSRQGECVTEAPHKHRAIRSKVQRRGRSAGARNAVE